MEWAPELIGFNLPERFSFSQMRSAEKCLFSAVPVGCLQLSQTWPSDRLGRAQLLGLIYHSLLESVSKRGGNLSAEQLSQAFDTALAVCSSRSVFAVADVKQWSEAETLFQTLVERICRKPHSGEETFVIRALIEKDFNSRDGLLTGRIDHLLMRDEKPWVLTEFKSSQCLIGETIRFDYIRQLHFYSGLIEDSFGHTPDTLRIVSIQDGNVEVPLSQTLVRQIIYDAKVLFDLMHFRLHEKANWTDSLKPGKLSCSQCSKRLVCPAFRSLQGTIEFDGPTHVVWGSVTECNVASGMGRIKLRASGGSLPHGDCQIFDYDTRHFPDFTGKVGEKVVISNLSLRDGAVRMSPTSQILQWSGDAI